MNSEHVRLRNKIRHAYIKHRLKSLLKNWLHINIFNLLHVGDKVFYKTNGKIFKGIVLGTDYSHDRYLVQIEDTEVNIFVLPRQRLFKHEKQALQSKSK